MTSPELRWMDALQVNLTEDKKGYTVVGDNRIPDTERLIRVTGVTNVLDKYGLRFWAMNQALDYIRDNRQHYSLPRYYIEDDPNLNDMESLLLHASKAHEQKRDTAADYGTEAHALLQELYVDTNISVPAKFQPVVDAWEQWLDESELQILAREQSLYYHDEPTGVSFAGTADVIAKDADGNYVICDYKTGASIYPEYSLQMAAYVKAFEQLYLYNVIMPSRFPYQQNLKVRAVIVKLPKEEGGELETRELNNIPYHQEAFIHAYHLLKWQSFRGKLLPKPRRKK